MKPVKGVAAVCFVSICFFSSAVFAQDAGKAALKKKLLSLVKACGCATSVDVCGDCAEATEIKEYVDKLIDSKVPEPEMAGILQRSFSSNLMFPENLPESPAAAAATAPQKGPVLSITPQVFDFGKVQGKGTSGVISGVFKLRNIGDEDVVIQNLRTSCSCTKVELRVGSSISPDFDAKGSGPGWNMSLKPGQEAELEVLVNVLELGVSSGKVERAVFVTSNSKERPISILKVVLDMVS